MPLTATGAGVGYASIMILPVALIAAGEWTALPPLVALGIGLCAGLSLSGSV